MDYMEYTGKTFGEILADLRQREGDVKIGAKDGSAFYWIGKCNKLTDKQIENIERDINGWAKKRILASENEIARLIHAKPTIEAYVEELVKNEEVEGCGSVEGYLDALRAWLEKLDNQKRLLIRKRQDYVNRKPLLQKKVFDAYLTVASWENNALVLILEGIEAGSFWDKLEANGEKLDTTRFKESADEQPDA